MATNRYIPTGRTSLVKRESGPLQLQTEYTYRPYPRITTTILDSGQVLHKIEKRLPSVVDSAEELVRMEEVIRQQHTEVEKIVQEQDTPQTATSPRDQTPVTTPPEREAAQSPNDLNQLLREVPGVGHIYRLGNDGTFHGQATAHQFKKAFAAIFKGLHDLLTLFDELPGPRLRRRRGVYEVERNQLYLISTGDECLFVAVNRTDPDTDYEKALKEAAFGRWGPDFIEP
ncbi:MAG: hypothetical protein KAW46_06575 [candidate division Zixibacteria bacterium]|nr:hypothetical protein [candidate division Zixibacteria bacterium]